MRNSKTLFLSALAAAAAWTYVVVLSASLTALADPRHGADIGRPGKADAVTRTISIEARDFAFDKQRIDVRAGETVRFVISNVGSLIHEFTIGTVDTQDNHRRMMREMMQGFASEEGRPDKSLHSEPNTITLAPGETKEIVWRFSRVDNIEFACNVPGHYESGMKGHFWFVDG